MPRGIAWDYLPSPFNRFRGNRNEVKNYMNYYLEPSDSEGNSGRLFDTVEDNSILKDMKEIGKSIAFGGVVGSLTGLMFGTVNALRDTTSMISRNTVGTKKILRTSGYFGTFFGVYHGIRKSLLTYSPSVPQEANVFLATTISVTPLVIMPKGRPIIPYAIFLIVLDVANNWKEHGSLSK